MNSNIASLQQKAASLLLYSSVLQKDGGKAFLNLLNTLQGNDALKSLQAYGEWFRLLATHSQSWQDYLILQILRDDNPFSRQVQHTSLEQLPRGLVQAATQDLEILQELSQWGGEKLSIEIQNNLNLSFLPIPWTVEASQSHVFDAHEFWSQALKPLANYYRQEGVGIFAEYQAFRWQNGQLQGIAHPDTTQLNHIVGYEWQKAALVQNTEFLLGGYSALNVLLYGSRGSGKSSLVKGLLQKYASQGLRLIEVGKSELSALPDIVEFLRSLPQKFIIFVDDLSFEEDDDAFKALKVVLEGSATAKAQNVVVYATSNRRHLIREYFADKPRPSDDEVHAWDTIQEKLSFSDRFGLTLTFENANQDTYLQIVHHLATQANILLDKNELEYRAKQWATRHNGRSGRTARQFIDFLEAELSHTP